MRKSSYLRAKKIRIVYFEWWKDLVQKKMWPLLIDLLFKKGPISYIIPKGWGPTQLYIFQWSTPMMEISQQYNEYWTRSIRVQRSVQVQKKILRYVKQWLFYREQSVFNHISCNMSSIKSSKWWQVAAWRTSPSPDVKYSRHDVALLVFWTFDRKIWGTSAGRFAKIITLKEPGNESKHCLTAWDVGDVMNHIRFFPFFQLPFDNHYTIWIGLFPFQKFLVILKRLLLWQS